jgi:hypothetical protein
MRTNVLSTKCVIILIYDLAKPIEKPWVYLHSGNQSGKVHKEDMWKKKNGSSKEREGVNQMSCQCIVFIYFIMFVHTYTHTHTHTDTEK